MKSSHQAQKILFGIAALSGVLALLGVLVGSLFFKALSMNMAWILAITLPVFILSCIAASALFLLIRMFQGDGLGKPFILSALVVLVGYGGLAALQIVRSRAARNSPRQRSETELASLTTNSAAFFDRVQQLAPLDDAYRNQTETLVGYQAFRRPNPEFASNYFARGTTNIPPGPWIARSLLFGIQELSPGSDPARLTNLAAVLQIVERHQPTLLRAPFVQREQTNSLRGFVEEDARTGNAPDRHAAVLSLLPTPSNR
jgi:hypothetical protein